MSGVTNFTTFPDANSDWAPKMLVYGDLGVKYGAIIPYITNEVVNRTVDLVFHNGDLAYDLGSVIILLIF